MKLQIDNLDGAGVRDYTAAVDAARPARIVRRLNRAAELQCSLVANAPSFVTPANGARIVLTGNGAQNIFTGYLTQAPALEYLGWGERGAVYRYGLIGLSDEVLLDRKRLPSRAPFVARSAGSALRQLDQDLLPGAFDTSGGAGPGRAAVLLARSPKEVVAARRGNCAASTGCLQNDEWSHDAGASGGGGIRAE